MSPEEEKIFENISDTSNAQKSVVRDFKKHALAETLGVGDTVSWAHSETTFFKIQAIL